MKFLIKCCFWFAVLVMVMPTDQGTQAKFYQTAEHTVGQVATFCDRSPGVCARGEVIWDTFKLKAAFAAGLATDMVMELAFGQRRSNAEDVSPVRTGRQTLSQQDRAPAWAGQRQTTDTVFAVDQPQQLEIPVSLPWNGSAMSLMYEMQGIMRLECRDER